MCFRPMPVDRPYITTLPSAELLYENPLFLENRFNFRGVRFGVNRRMDLLTRLVGVRKTQISETAPWSISLGDVSSTPKLFEVRRFRFVTQFFKGYSWVDHKEVSA